MTLAKIAPGSRGVLRRHGWLLMAWAATVGIVTSSVLLYVFKVHAMGLRYAVSAASIYFVGFMLAGWWYARWWAGRRADALRHATPQEQLDYDQEQARLRSNFSGLDFFNIGGDDPLSVLLSVLCIALLAVAALFMAAYLPVLATDAFAGYLAEIVIEFVIGGIVYRHVLKPRTLDDYWSVMTRKTLLAGMFFIVACGGAGYAVQQINPEAQTLLQLLH